MIRFLLLPFCLIGCLYSQTFAPVGAEWYYSEGEAMSSYRGYARLEVLKDTLYKGYSCKKILNGAWGGSCVQQPNYMYVYEVDSVVYYWEQVINDFQILYNFKAKKGEKWSITIKDYPNENTVDIYFKVDSVKLVMQNETSLKELYLSYGYQYGEEELEYNSNSKVTTWLGDDDFLFNIFPESYGVCTGGYVSGLRCYEDDEIGLYSTGLTETCDFVTTSVDEFESQEIVAFPNPVLDILIVSFRGLSDVQVEVIDVYGKIVDAKTGVESVSFDLSLVDPGVYFVSVKKQGQLLFTKKVFKQ